MNLPPPAPTPELGPTDAVPARIGPPRFFASLTYKQALATLLIVLVLGVIGGAFELLSELQATQEEVREDMSRTLALVRGPATDAAFQISERIASGVVGGLIELGPVVEVRLRDNFGAVLASAEKPDHSKPLDHWLFADVTRFSLPLVQRDGVRELDVGRLDVLLSPGWVAERFFSRAMFNGLAGLVRALAICVLLVLVFYLLMTRPLVRLSRSIAEIDPARPGANLQTAPRGHGEDEIGVLVRALNQLLSAFQNGLQRRDKAEAELLALTQELEQRVMARTQELEAAMQALGREKEETERAFASLDTAHRELDRTNGLLLESIHYASKIQDALLPHRHALDEVLAEVGVIWEPLHMVGGDYFWMEKIGDECVIFVADCTGHGVPGAFMTMIVASALDRLLHEQGLREPTAILAGIDDMVRNRLRQDRPGSSSDDGLDAGVCIFRAGGEELRYAGANLSLLLLHGDQVEEIKGTRGSLGYRTIRPKKAFVEHRIPIRAGDRFFLFTDGAPDHMGGVPRRLLGRRRLSGFIAEHGDLPLAAQIAAIQQRLEDYRGEEPRRDDMTLVAFRPR